MAGVTYERRRGELETYFDRTAAEAWARLTSDAPVSGVRATVRAGRDEMRATLLSWLPADLTGASLIDAGCGTGALAVAAARRGCDVTAVDLSPTLLDLARERLPTDLAPGRVTFFAGDMRQAGPDRFTHAVAMDSFIHYPAPEILKLIEAMAARAERSIVFTFAPRTTLLTVMHGIGQLFPRGDRSPAIEPVSEAKLRRLITGSAVLAGWRIGRTHRVARGFYISQAMELFRP